MEISQYLQKYLQIHGIFFQVHYTRNYGSTLLIQFIATFHTEHLHHTKSVDERTLRPHTLYQYLYVLYQPAVQYQANNTNYGIEIHIETKNH